MSLRYAYLHGFGSSPNTHKGVILAQEMARRGATLERPDLNAPSFAKLSTLAALSRIDEMAGDDRWCFVGSSMGGYLAARWAETHPAQVEKLVLLCPGFELATRWPAIVGPAMMAKWKSDGAFPFLDHGTGKMTPVHYAFYEEGRQLPARPLVPCPTTIFHGRRDPTVPIEVSRSYAKDHADRVTLVELDDVHELVASLPLIIPQTLLFFGL